MSSEHHTPSSDLEGDNAELRRRLNVAEATLDDMRTEALERRAEVRALAESLPTAMSRHALLRSMARDALHHPDKAGVVKRAIAKAGRAPRKAVRLVRERT
jgi:hypothetical protein